MTRPLLMGILNVTPDSFSDGGMFSSLEGAVEHGIQLAADGADWVDVGGESTRPGADTVPSEVEAARVVPVIAELVRRGVRVSVDTRKADVARQALAAGAEFINDVSAWRDPEMAEVCSRAGAGVCLMHMPGDPQTMQGLANYVDIVAEVGQFLSSAAQAALGAGLAKGSIFLDPGIGFGKTTAQNIALLKATAQFKSLGFPILIGVSRKSFLGRILSDSDAPAPVAERAHASLAAEIYAASQGADMIRTHDVKGLRQAIQVWAALA